MEKTKICKKMKNPIPFWFYFAVIPNWKLWIVSNENYSYPLSLLKIFYVSIHGNTDLHNFAAYQNIQYFAKYHEAEITIPIFFVITLEMEFQGEKVSHSLGCAILNSSVSLDCYSDSELDKLFKDDKFTFVCEDCADLVWLNFCSRVYVCNLD